MQKLFLLFCIMTCGIGATAQSLTGVWRGYFYSGYGYFREQYKYEVQIDHQKTNAIKGVTYSYRTTVFYGKANMQGIYFIDNKNVLIKELNLVELKIADKTDPCAMTCNLEYSKTGKLEVLSGTFTSVNINTKKDCGSGTVYLEKVAESDFKKEDFLIKKPTAKQPATEPQKKVTPGVTEQKKTAPQTSNQQQKQTKPPVTEKKMAPPPQQQKTKPVPKTVDTIAVAEKKVQTLTPQKKILPPPPALLKSRSNTLIKTLATSSPDILIELYDNGEIDGDTVTVFHNNSIIANKRKLTDKPISIKVLADEVNTLHEFIMVANNLGSIPPNTALMVITTGGKRYEVFLTADNNKNAKVIIEYKKP